MFGDKLKDIRSKRGYTQQKLADELSITSRTIAFWEANERTPSLEYLSRICDIFNVSADYMLGRTAKETERTDMIPEPLSIAAHKTNGSSSEVKDERMEDIIIQAYNLIMQRRSNES